MLHQWVYQLFDMVLFGVVVVFVEIPFCVAKFGIEMYVPTFKSVAGVNREFLWEFKFCLCNNFWLFLNKFHCAFHLCLKFIRYVYRKLILKFVGDESDLHRGYAVVDCNILIL